MKKSVAITSGVVIVLAGAWLGATWYTGKKIESRMQEDLLRANEELKVLAPPLGLRIEQIKYERGFFSADAEYALRSDLPKSVGEGPSNQELRFKTHIQHGPFPAGAISRGKLMPQLAFVHAELAQTDLLKPVFELTKGATPLWADTLVSYQGKARTEGAIAAIQYSDDKGMIDFSGAQFSGDFDRKTRTGAVHLQSQQVLLNIKEGGSPVNIKLAELSVDAESRQGKFGISIGKSGMKIKRIEADDVNSETKFAVTDFAYDVDIGETDTHVQGSGAYRVGNVNVRNLDFGGGELAVKLENLDGKAVQNLNDVYTKMLRGVMSGTSTEGGLDGYTGDMAMVMGAGTTLLAGNPTIKVEPLSWKTDKGESRFTLAVTLAKPTSIDLPRNELARQLIKSVDARLTLNKPMVNDIATKVLQTQGVEPAAAKREADEQIDTLAGMAEMMNFGKNDGDNIVSTFTYADGKGMLNGQEVPVDDLFDEMLGGLNPDDMDGHDGMDNDFDTPLSDSDTINEFTPEFVGSVIDQAGYAYTEDLGEQGPVFKVQGDLSATEVRIDLNCEFEEGCLEMAWVATFERKQSPSLKAINAWNRDHRWNRAYLDDDGRAVLQMDLVAEGGIGKTNTRYQFDAFLDLIEAFSDTVYGAPAR
ncbi:DUF945 family protein [Bordetella genomosp. 5]|nr:DUF945 family protein [Bordetella genomosp. 5]